jgi:hypothetical protein
LKIITRPMEPGRESSPSLPEIVQDSVAWRV